MEPIAIRNAYTNWLLQRGDDGQLAVAPPGPQLADARWHHDTSSGLSRFSDPDTPRRNLVMDGEAAIMSVTQPRALEALWILEPIDGSDWCRIKSRSNPNHYLNTEHGGQVAAGPIEPGWMSAMWAIDQEVVRFGVDDHMRPPTVFVEDARSVHLRYAGSDVSAMYNEVTAIESALGTYFMAVGFAGGYIGMQERVDGSKIAIFSVWNNKVNDVVHTTTVVRASSATVAFPPEGGSGQSIRVALDWQVGEKVAFAVTAEPDGAGTNFTGYFRRCSGLGTNPEWFFMATFHRPATGGARMSHLYSFVEDFRRNGAEEGVAAADRSPYHHHVANFSNPWIRDADGTWTHVAEAEFAAFSGEPRNPLLNIDGVLVPGGEICFQLATGGWWVQRTALGATLHSDGTRWPNLPS